MSSILTTMLSKLSDEDKQIFEQLSIKLKHVKGDISLLAKEDLDLIQQMESKYGDSINQVRQTDNGSSKIDILETGFAQQVRQIIARDLGAKYPLEEEAITFVFENKWLPIDCQDKTISAELYQRFELDIKEANQWREDLGDLNADKTMAVGLAWFMVVFQLNKRLSDEIIHR